LLVWERELGYTPQTVCWALEGENPRAQETPAALFFFFFFFFLSFTPHPKGLFFVLDLRALRLKTSGWYACSQGMRRERESSHVQKKED
jgi:hypothetical protein